MNVEAAVVCVVACVIPAGRGALITRDENPTFDGWCSALGIRTFVGMDDKVAIIVTTTTRPGRRDEVRALYQELLAPRAVENEGQEVVVWSDDQHDPNTFHLFEVYRDMSVMGANAQAPWFAEYMAKVGPMLAGEPKVTMLTPRWSTGV